MKRDLFVSGGEQVDDLFAGKGFQGFGARDWLSITISSCPRSKGLSQAGGLSKIPQVSFDLVMVTY